LQDGEATLATLHGLRQFGVRISMDDFEAGYSSLSYLRSFPPKAWKRASSSRCCARKDAAKYRAYCSATRSRRDRTVARAGLQAARRGVSLLLQHLRPSNQAGSTACPGCRCRVCRRDAGRILNHVFEFMDPGHNERIAEMKSLLIASALALAPFGAPASAQMIEYGKNRAGSDIVNFDLTTYGSPENCQGACMANSSCVAWTFVRTGEQARTPRCWLKNYAPPATDNACCVSGVK